MILVSLFACALVAFAFLGLFNPRETIIGPQLKAFTTLGNPHLAELSGLVASEQYPGTLWAHNDSGNEPRLFAVSLTGELRGQSADEGMKVEGASLKDWEAIARVGDRLYIGEVGNNFNKSQNLGLYQVKEPTPTHSGSLEVERFVKLRYPDQSGFPPSDRWHFDCEAMFGLDHFIYFITKNRPAYRLWVQEGTANLYRLDLDELKNDSVNVLELVDSAKELGGWVTAADLSEDGRWLALVIESPLQSIWLFERPVDGDKFLSEAKSVKRFVFHNGGQLESLAFAGEGGEALYMVNEDREMFRVDFADFEEVDRVVAK